VHSSQETESDNGRPTTTKQLRLMDVQTKMSNVMGDILENCMWTASEGEQANIKAAAVSDRAEVQTLLTKPKILLSESTTAWWRDNEHLFPQVDAVA